MVAETFLHFFTLPSACSCSSTTTSLLPERSPAQTAGTGEGKTSAQPLPVPAQIPGSPWQWMQDDSRNNLSRVCCWLAPTSQSLLAATSHVQLELLWPFPRPTEGLLLAFHGKISSGVESHLPFGPQRISRDFVNAKPRERKNFLRALHMWLEVWRFPLTSSSAFGMCSKVVLAWIQLRTSCVDPITQNPRITEP